MCPSKVQEIGCNSHAHATICKHRKCVKESLITMENKTIYPIFHVKYDQKFKNQNV